MPYIFSLLLLLALVPNTHAISLRSDYQQTITATKNHLLTMLYHIQPEITYFIPETLVFSDVEEDIWYETACRYIVSQKIMAGTSETTFSPDLHVSRGLLAVVLSNADEADLGIYPNVFHDASSQWYRDSTNWAAQNNLMIGYSSDIFGGEDPVTREQLAIILYQYQKYLGGSVSNSSDSALRQFSDQSATTGFGRTALSWCINQGYLISTDNRNIFPQYPATRAEVAYALYHFLEG